MSQKKPDQTDELKRVNQKIIAQGEVLPIVKLKDGSPVQTGTVATMLHNIKLYDQGVRGEIEEELKISIPTLLKVGLFDLFPPEEWIKGTSPGRRFLGERALEFLKFKK